MADKKISQLTAATTPLAGTEVVPVVQSGATKKVTVSDLTAGRAVSATSLSVTSFLRGTGGAGAKVEAAASGITGGYFVGVGTPDASGFYHGKIVVSRDASTYSYGSQVDIFTEGKNTANATDTSTSKMTFDSLGNAKVNLGNLVIGTSGKGIDFSADASAAGMTSELLDDYEEGTFTPTLSADTPFDTVTYSNQYGHYTKIGNRVFVDIYLQTSGTTGGSGTLKIEGLPFSAKGSSTYQSVGTCVGYGITFAGTLLVANVPQGTATINFLTQSSGGAYAALASTDWGSGVKLMKISVNYIAN